MVNENDVIDAGLVARRFRALFDGLTRAYGTLELVPTADAAEKRTGDYKMVEGPVTDHLWILHLSGERGLHRARDDGTVRFGAIDIDNKDFDLVKVSNT